MSMLALIGNHLWQSTAFTTMLGLATLGLRKNRAAVRHMLWLAASIKFLLPFSALVALGGLLGLRSPAPLVQRQVTLVIELAAQPFLLVAGSRAGGSAISRAGTFTTALVPIVVAIWAAGSLVILGSWRLRWRRVAEIARAAARIDGGCEYETLRRLERRAGLARPIALVSSTASLEPGVFGVLRPVLVWPRTIGARLNEDEMRSILAHEVSHVRRRDNLTAAIHMVVEALFWFHPLVWWIGSRLVDERERACDEDVLRSGNEPETYAETILKTCRAYLEVPRACGAGVTGSNLAKRIERIMNGGGAEPLATGGKVLLATVAVATVVTPIVVGAVTAKKLHPRYETVSITAFADQAGSVSTASPALPQQPLPQFEVASIKPNKSGDGRIMMQVQPGGRFTAINVTLRILIRNAYRLQDSQIVGGPGWMSDDHFDVVAKAESGDGPGDPFAAEKPGETTRGQLMIRALLADRFKLETHEETREMPIYALVPAHADGKLGPQLHQSETDCNAIVAAARARGAVPPPAPPQPGDRVPCGMRIGPGNLTAGSSTMTQFANSLSMFVGRIVEDRTGLAGNFDFNLTWTPDQMPQRPPGAPEPPIDPNGASIFTALQEQLGLKLDSQKGPVRVLVIDRAEHPTEN
jgi:uncharacterized protein (TIGR03435 family)